MKTPDNQKRALDGSDSEDDIPKPSPGPKQNKKARVLPSDSEDEDINLCTQEDLEDLCTQEEPTIQTTPAEYSFEVLTPEEVISSMNGDVDLTCAVVDLPKGTVTSLLQFVKWDQENLVEALVTGGDSSRDEFFDKACVVNPIRKLINADSAIEDCQCPVCSENLPSADMEGIGCGHRFCTHCWSAHISTQIKDKGTAQISCLAHNCKFLLEPESVIKFVEDPHIQKLYSYLSTKNYVECQKYVKWCPSPACPNAIKINLNPDGTPVQGTVRVVECSCGYDFCFECVQIGHAPVTCDILKKWLTKCQDSETKSSIWIQVNTKNCPKCKSKIEKNGGCNHMTCRGVSCRYEFCWICMGRWPCVAAECNRYAPPTEEMQERSSTRASLKRYLHYFDRFKAHESSLKLEQKTMALASSEVRLPWESQETYKNALKCLVHCRKLMMFSYVFAFYAKENDGNNQIGIFQMNQEHLHGEIEKLSGFFEDGQVNVEALKSKQSDIRHSISICTVRANALKAHAAEGYIKNWWIFGD